MTNDEKIRELKASTAWSEEYDLPLVPRANNPWLYMAYAVACTDDVLEFNSDFTRTLTLYGNACDLKPGVFDRFPGKPGNTSHDEVMGRLYLDRVYAEEFLEHMVITDWYFNSAVDRSRFEDSAKILFDERDSLHRFVFMEPFARACAGNRKVGLLSQLLWSVHVLSSAFYADPDKDTSGILKIWLMGRKMEKFPTCGLAFSFWKWNLKRKYGLNPKAIFAKWYLTEEPVFALIAPETFGE